MKNLLKKFNISNNLPFIIVILIGLTLLVSYFVLTKDYASEKTKTKSAIEEYEENLPSLEKNVKKNPEDKEAIRDYAVALYATGNLEEAKEYYEKEVELNQNDAVLRNNLGNVYRDLEDYDKAVESYEKALEIDNTMYNTYHNLCNLLVYTLDRAEEAVEIYQNAIETLPEKEEELLNSMGLAYEQLDEDEKALETYERVLEINPANNSAKAGLERLK